MEIGRTFLAGAATRIFCLLPLLSYSSGAAEAVENGSALDLIRLSKEISNAADQYYRSADSTNPGREKSFTPEIRKSVGDFRNNVRKTNLAFTLIREYLESGPASEEEIVSEAFRARHDDSKLGGWRSLTRGNRLDLTVLNRYLDSMQVDFVNFDTLEDVDLSRRVACCRAIPIDSAAFSPEKYCAVSLSKFGDRYHQNFNRTYDRIAASIQRDREVSGRYDHKLIHGFPAMPWENIINFRSKENGPTPVQLIWLHPFLAGIKHYDDARNTPLGFEPALAVQAAGLNFYNWNWKGLRYLGGALVIVPGIEWEDVRVGGILHLGNWISLGVVAPREEGTGGLLFEFNGLTDKLSGVLLK